MRNTDAATPNQIATRVSLLDFLGSFCRARLAPGGLLIFSTNFRKFRLDSASLSALDVRDVTVSTIPKDFARDAKIHHCYELRLPAQPTSKPERRTIKLR